MGEDEVGEWTPKIAGPAGEANEVHLVVNTNNAKQGPTTADLIGRRLRGGKIGAAIVPAGR